MTMETADFAPYFRRPPPAEPESAIAGYDRGYADGQASQIAQAQRLLASGVERVESLLGAVERDLAERFLALEDQAARLALVFARQFCAGADVDEARVLRAFRLALPDMITAPTVAVALNPELAACLQDRMAAALRDESPDARLVVQADASISPGDCRLVWRGGAVILDKAALERRLLETIARAFATLQPGAP